MTTTFHDARCDHCCCCGPTKKRGDADGDANSTVHDQTTTMIQLPKERKTTRVWWLGNALDDVDGTEDDQTGRIRRENDDCDEGAGSGGGFGDDSSARHGPPRANGHDGTRHQRTRISRDETTRPPP